MARVSALAGGALSSSERSRLHRQKARESMTNSVASSGIPLHVVESPLHPVFEPVVCPAPPVLVGLPAISEIPLHPKRYVTVTRTEPAKTGRGFDLDFVPFFSPFAKYVDPFRHVFCDWLTIYQEFPQGGLPLINGGFVVGFESHCITQKIDPETGVLGLFFDATLAEFTTHKRIEHEGSYETSIQIRCDGFRLELSGNVSRFGRPDNLYGLSVLECVEKASDIAEALTGHRFTDMDRQTPYAHGGGHMKTNAVITRVDLTANFATGGRNEAFLILDSYLGQGTKRGGCPPKYYKNGISWNEGSKRHYEKLYYKAAELGLFVSDEVRNYCEENGILRFEVSLKSRELADRNLNRVVCWSKVEAGERMENVIFGKFAEVLHRQQACESLELSDIPGKFRMVAQAYLDGRDPYSTMVFAERTKRRWRAALLPYGLDIAIPLNVVKVQTRIRTLDLVPLSRPDWYKVAA